MANYKKHLSTLSSISFLDEVAQAVSEEKRPEACVVVLPSFRAVATFRRAYAKLKGKACRIPKAMTLGAFMEGDKSIAIADNLEVLARLYAVQLQLPDGHEGFDLFMGWGPIALSDFHAIDHYRLDAKTVFKNLRDIKEIEDWSFDSDKELTKDQIRFMEQWARLYPLYKELHKNMEDEGIFTKARVSRKVAEEGSTKNYDRVFAAGLAAITPSEKLYLNKWRKAEKLSFFHDADISYIGDKQVEAGSFIRELEPNKEELDRLSTKLSSNPPQISIIGCSSVVSSCQYVREIILSLDNEERNKTVIVLPDASTLTVLLQSLPAEKDGYNVTMGLSLRETPIHSFLNIVNRMTSRREKNWRFEDLMSISSQQVLSKGFGNLRVDASKALHSLAGQHFVWVSSKKLSEESRGPFSNLIRDLEYLKVPDAEEYLERLEVWTTKIEKALEKSDDPWVKAGWKCVRKVVGVTTRLQKHYSPCSTADEIRVLMKKLMSVEKINLVGEPAQGLQIMGLTESRSLDFNRVIVLDCNEGLLPKHEIKDSFIPVDLQYSLGLPGRHEREAAYAYSLYRLFNRSKEVHLLYTGSNGGKQGNEISRYILQIKDSFKPDGTNHLPINEVSFSMPLPAKRPEIPPLFLTEKTRSRLTEWSKDGMSPSALNTMVGCERNFAYRYLLRLSEPRDIEESLESSTLGSIVHHVFEKGLEKSLREKLETYHLKSILTDLDVLIKAAVKKYYNEDIAHNGENLLLLRSAKSTINKLIQKEISELQSDAESTIKIQSLEEKLSAAYTLDDGTEISFRGLADRIETVDGNTRIVDYKTGIAKEPELRLKDDWEEKLDKGKSGKALQLLVYCALLLNNSDSPDTTVQAAIRSGRNAKAGLMYLNIDKRKDITSEDVSRLLNWVINRLTKYREEGRKLDHNPDSHYCEYCVVLDPPIKSFN